MHLIEGDVGEILTVAGQNLITGPQACFSRYTTFPYELNEDTRLPVGTLAYTRKEQDILGHRN